MLYVPGDVTIYDIWETQASTSSIPGAAVGLKSEHRINWVIALTVVPIVPTRTRNNPYSVFLIRVLSF